MPRGCPATAAGVTPAAVAFVRSSTLLSGPARGVGLVGEVGGGRRARDVRGVAAGQREGRAGDVGPRRRLAGVGQVVDARGGAEQRDDPGREIVGEGGPADLVVDDGGGDPAGGEVEHGAHEVGAVAHHPGRAHDQVPRGERSRRSPRRPSRPRRRSAGTAVRPRRSGRWPSRRTRTRWRRARASCRARWRRRRGARPRWRWPPRPRPGPRASRPGRRRWRRRR